MNFSGPGIPLTQDGLDYAADTADIGLAEI